MGITIALWQSFTTQQYFTIQNLARNNAENIGYEFQRAMGDDTKALRRIALRWQALDGYSKALWDIDTKAYINDLAGLFSVSWVNADLKLQDYSSKEGGPARLYALKPLQDKLKEIQSSPFKESIQSVKIEENLIFLLPLIGKYTEFLGILVADVNLPTLVEKSIPGFIYPYYNIEIYENNELILKKEQPGVSAITLGATVDLPTQFANWKIKVRPNTLSLPIIESFLPSLIIISGMLITAFMALATILLQFILRSKKQLSIALREKSEAFAYKQAILDSSNYSIISIKNNGMIFSYNKGAEKMLQWTADEMIGKQSPILFHDKDEIVKRAKELSEKLNQVIEPGMAVFTSLAKRSIADEREWTYIRKDGSRFPVLLSITAAKNVHGEIVGFVGVASDLTQFKEVEKMKNELIGITSHELRSPITSIKGSLDLIATDQNLSPNVLSLLDIARSNANRLIALTNDILDLQKIDAGKMEFHFTNLKVRELVEKSILANQPLALTQKIYLQSSKMIPDITIHGDEDRLMQVITNLISNALKYSPVQGTICIIVTKKDKSVRIAVKDQGPGIPIDLQEKLFQKFSQLSIDGIKAKTGTGLGLNICKSIVEKHNGTIGLDSTPQGSTFWFELPFVAG